MLLPNKHVDKDAHHVLLVLASYAKSDGSQARPGLPTLARESYMSVTATADALDRIQAAGLISKTADLNGGTVVWQLHLDVRSSGLTVLDERAEHKRAKDRARKRRDRARVHPQSPVTPSVDEPVDNSRVHPHSPVTCPPPEAADVHPHKGWSPTPVGVDVPPQWVGQPQLTPATTATPELPLNCQTHTTRDRDAEFDAFWKAYPKRVSKAGARTKWDAAIKRGIDPAVILAGAQRYATERAGADPRYTKHPTTWLNQGCWDDEPQPELGLLRVVGGYEPYRDPIDQSVYDERL
ncbi:MAG: hypothetical protein HOV67_34700 [Kribbellaceae bacterium]|nr:hypothetical protein [Kribbellaceae bacterium]